MSDIEYLQESVAKGLVEILMSERGLSLQDALAIVGDSRTFDLVMDAETALYRESPSYLYEMLQDELAERGHAARS